MRRTPPPRRVRRRTAPRRRRPESLHPARTGFSVATRIAFGIGAVALIAAGVALLASGTPTTARRLGRLAGLAIVAGLLLAWGAARGRL